METLISTKIELDPPPLHPWDWIEVDGASIVPRIQELDLGGVVGGVSGDQDEVMGNSGGGNQAVQHREASTLELVAGAEAAPFVHYLGIGGQEAWFHPFLESDKPLLKLLATLALGQEFQSFDNFTERDGGKVGFMIMSIKPGQNLLVRM